MSIFLPFVIILVGIHASPLPSLLVHIRSYPGSHGPESHTPDERWTREGKDGVFRAHVQYVSTAGENANIYSPCRPDLEKAAADLASTRAAAAVFPVCFGRRGLHARLVLWMAKRKKVLM